MIDGDTLEIHGERIRLNGIDAPESRQTCQRADGSEYRCGQGAAFALADWIGRATVTCEPHGHDRYRRVIATCYARGEDAGRWLVQNGHALAFRRYSLVYVPDEERAQAAGSGVWQGHFILPWDWRKGAR
ncbi:thermonuclease family protein [Ancylobacter sp. TS-1]|uniref:thermonuclease family protein n=1 Tax=Ancylobacter sp. TS-1 TaxID=1850374 RepID=UPI0013910540|nr:thermonuclease family protein [Ancylobacter sp. TS-1]